MGIKYHPKQGTVVRVDFDKGFVPPEMVKPRLAIVVSKPVQRRIGLCTVVPLSTSPPEHAMPYHAVLDVGVKLPPSWGKMDRWIKGDMVCSVSWNRTDLLRIGKTRTGERVYQLEPISDEKLAIVLGCVLHGIGLSNLTKHIK